MKILRSLSETHPNLLAEWDYGKNSPLTPKDITAGSHKKVWWRCKHGHSWKAEVKSRIGSLSRAKGTGCPYCHNKKVLIGFNDLATTNPDLAAEWDYGKNNPLTPKDVVAGSNKRVWWRCKYGHSWKVSVANRNKGSRCPHCNSQFKTSFSEQALFYYLQRDCIQAISRHQIATSLFGTMEADIWLPNLNTAIEYDGLYWHLSKKDHDIQKDKAFMLSGIKIIRIKEGRTNSIKHNCITYNFYKNRNINFIWAIRQCEEMLNITPQNIIDPQKDEIQILKNYIAINFNISFFTKCPKISLEWDYERNNKLTPKMFSAVSGMKVWWKCKHGHSWKDSIAHRAYGRDCPYCHNKKVLIGFNDLATTNPDLAAEWDYEKNNPLTPRDVTSGSGKEIWWRCKHGHSWKAYIYSRKTGNKCPICANQLLLVGFNDLATTNPDLAAEWDYEKNNPLTPKEVMAGSDKKVWWWCKYGHAWKAYIYSRKAGHGCPICARKSKLKFVDSSKEIK